MRHAEESARETQALKQEVRILENQTFRRASVSSFPVICVLMDMHFVGQIARLKEELNTARRQDTGSQQIIQDERTRAAQHGDEAAQPLTPRKRQRAQSPGGGEGAGNSNDRPVRRARTTSGSVSREKIRDVLGGSDRGWGSTMSR